MKRILYVAGAAVLAGAALAGWAYARKKAELSRDTDCIDGGVVTHNAGENAPKVIESTEITDFSCEISLIAHLDVCGLENSIYKLEAALKDGTVTGSIERKDRNGHHEDLRVEAKAPFMQDLQSIVAKYDLAQYNGFYHHVSGLPNLYGAILDIRYASGEAVHAHDNQSCFLPVEAVKELVDLFAPQEQGNEPINHNNP